MKGALVRAVPQEQFAPEPSPAVVEAGQNIVTFAKKKTEIDEYFEMYGEAFSVMETLTPPGLMELILPTKVRIRYYVAFLFIEEMREGAYEVASEVEVPDEFCSLARSIAILESECRRIVATKPFHFKKTYDQDAMAPVFPPECQRFMEAIYRGTKLIELEYGDLLREFGVLPPITKSPAV